MTERLVPTIADADGYLIAFSTKSDGNMLRTNETRVAVHNNRLRFLEKNRVPQDRLFVIRTCHSPNVEVIDVEPGVYVKRTYLQQPIIDTDFDHYYTGSDGAITFNKNLFIGLMSGDCVPVLLWDNSSGMHGILHVGLLGALNRMVTILPKVFERSGTVVSNARVYLGPSITQRNYNVSRSGLWAAIAAQTREKIPDVDRYITRDNSIEHFDVQGMIIDQLLECGVANEHIQRYEHCVADPGSLFFSHNVLKQSGERGSFFSVIGMKSSLTG
jgi:purine-nucleoside/S-methyl-5'-thioadenosine phosphorylase / adenosine deaminase